jgi:hypothetical protein
MSDRPSPKCREELVGDFDAIMSEGREALVRLQAAQGKLLESIERTRTSVPPTSRISRRVPPSLEQIERQVAAVESAVPKKVNAA